MTDLTQNNALGLAVAGVEPLGIEYKQTLKMRLDLFDESIVATRYEDGKATAAHEIAPDDLAAAFAGLPLTTGLLPPGCLFFGRSGSQDRIAIYLPGGRRDLSVEGKRTITLSLPLPPLVFAGHGVNYAVYAIKRYPSATSDHLFHAPFPNVHRDGSICPGTVDFPTCTTETIHAAAALFLESRFNHDLSNNKCRSHPKSIVALWRDLAKRNVRKFPYSDLIDAGKTICDLLGG